MLQRIPSAVLAAALTCSACGGDFFITGIQPVDAMCAPRAQSGLGASLDIGGVDGAEKFEGEVFDPRYFAQISFGQATGNRPLVLEKKLLTYSLLLPGARAAKALRPDTVDVFHVVNPPTEPAPFVTNILGPKGIDDLVSNISASLEEHPPASEVAKLVVSIDVQGRASGGGPLVNSGPVAYPIAISRAPKRFYCSGFDLDTEAPNSCRNPGQDVGPMEDICR